MTVKTVNLNTLENVEVLLFSDNAPHVRLKNIEKDDYVNVICSMTSPLKVLQFLEVSNAIDKVGARKMFLYIPYLMGARYDRVMVAGDSFDLEVISNLINSCNFQMVNLFDVHSEMALNLIKYSHNHIPNLLKTYTSDNKDEIIYICPDKGAIFRIPKNVKDENIVYCEKSRDLSNGNIVLKVLEPEKCENKECIIVDDICDGGMTFILIAKQIKPSILTLAVTHGIFSKGFLKLNEFFDAVITTDSLEIDESILNEARRLRVLKLDLDLKSDLDLYFDK